MDKELVASCLLVLMGIAFLIFPIQLRPIITIDDLFHKLSPKERKQIKHMQRFIGCLAIVLGLGILILKGLGKL